MALDPHSYIRVLAVRHYLARARALESFTRFTLSLAEQPGTSETAAPQVPDEPGNGERAPRREPDRPTRPRRTVPAHARPKGSRARRRRNRR